VDEVFSLTLKRKNDVCRLFPASTKQRVGKRLKGEGEEKCVNSLTHVSGDKKRKKTSLSDDGNGSSRESKRKALLFFWAPKKDIQPTSLSGHTGNKKGGGKWFHLLAKGEGYKKPPEKAVKC